ncbi:laglidadg endonuclease (mitochondrion) [Sclerotinia sclerotiorum 1980 UF-70]|uniref:Laglidadg endonuclease n=1 Tax=Sclerotinia sclerotiorum (strain ATCC 18683 / 1980 / Ss-1) TaxID=665079 RepID=A0A0K0PSX6_SCLS1|nr:laglidadg endonuclease [Sclerotinia sclerotiorum 1980 UF-70]AKQ53310.1 laglidadg endonuclease [Sclerotinia sclerotiorum 1980 UF-70]
MINPYWFAGFTSGEGSFSAEILKSSSHKKGYQVILKLSISQHTRDVELLKCFISFLGGGFVKERTSISEFVVVKLSLTTEELIPLFQKYPIIGNKNKDFIDFCKIAESMSNNAHKTPEGLDKIREIKSGMNRSRK